MSPKTLADGITATRALLSVVLVALGVTLGADALPWAAAVMIADWTGDALDGALARRDPDHPQTWIGRRDLEVDTLVSAGLLIYLVAADLIPFALAAAYVIGWLLVFLRWGFLRSLGMLVQAPVYAWFIGCALTQSPVAGACLVAWVVAVIAITWPRFPRVIVPGFLRGLRRQSTRVGGEGR